jgi:prevent-host-death family protein
MEISVTATQAKNDFGHILEQVIRGGTVVITKHDTPKAVMIPVEQYERLSRSGKSKLDELRAEFDALLESMQTPASRAARDAAFNMTPKEIGRAAVAAARKRAR